MRLDDAHSHITGSDNKYVICWNKADSKPKVTGVFASRSDQRTDMIYDMI